MCLVHQKNLLLLFLVFGRAAPIETNQFSGRNSALHCSFVHDIGLYFKKFKSKLSDKFTSVVICIFSMVNLVLWFQKKSRINTLISVVNQLEKKLLVATKEISLLEEQLTDAPVALVIFLK